MLSQLEKAKADSELSTVNTAQSMFSGLEDEVESKVKVAIGDVLKRQMEVATNDTNSRLQKHFHHLLEVYVKVGLAGQQATAVNSAEATEIESRECLMHATDARL